MLEVEAKYRVDRFDVIVETLLKIGAKRTSKAVQVDCYFAHPNRDFLKTGEAFRIRKVGEHVALTYKGPKGSDLIKLRREIELPFASGVSLRDVSEMVESLGFFRVAEVSKERDSWIVSRCGVNFTVALDLVDGLGAFVEVETMVQESSANEAMAAISMLSEDLSLANPIRDSYLALLLGESDG
jgi:adenylate cyclase class 2